MQPLLNYIIDMVIFVHHDNPDHHDQHIIEHWSIIWGIFGLIIEIVEGFVELGTAHSNLFYSVYGMPIVIVD